jgi:glycosyltransferase involved in cell wall biosynthesis
MKILILTRYSSLGASSRVRFFQYIPYLEANGVEIAAFPLLNDAYLKRIYAGQGKPAKAVMLAYFRRFIQLLKASRASEYDLLWIEKELFPYLPAWGEALLEAFAVPFVVDYDDSIFHDYDLHRNGIVRALLGDKIDQVMRKAALVVAGNGYLAERARQAGAKRVECLPSVVDLVRYQVAPPPERAIFTIGWIGSPTTAEYLHQIKTPLAEVCGDGKSRLILVGSGDVDLPGLRPDIHHWAESTEVGDIQSFDVGIMPLTDTPWSRGKCGFKLIQCMACGRPVIASPVGANNQIVEHGISGYLASTDEEWIQALATLRGDLARRVDMGKAARKKVEREYSMQVTAPLLLDLLKSSGRAWS